jgi:antirestriction protein ArdC
MHGRLRRNPHAIFTAASKAQQAADWMHAQQPVSAGERASSAIPDKPDAGQFASPVLTGAL